MCLSRARIVHSHTYPTADETNCVILNENLGAEKKGTGAIQAGLCQVATDGNEVAVSGLLPLKTLH